MRKQSGGTLKNRKPRAKRTIKPKHKVVIRAFCFPMEVSYKQSEMLMMTVEACHRLRNNLVQDRERNRLSNKLLKQNGKKTAYLGRADQYKSIVEYARRDTALSGVHSQVRQNVAVRVDEGYKRFFEALAEGRSNVHPPRYIDLNKYRSFTYPQYGFAAHIKRSRLYLSGIGDFRIFDYRRIKGRPKTVTIKFKQGRWWCIVTAEMQEKDVVLAVDVAKGLPDAAIDMGLLKLMADSQGMQYDPPKAWYERRKQLAMAQKKMSRQFEARKILHARIATLARDSGQPAPKLRDMMYSNRLTKQIRKVAKIHTKIDRIRDNHHKKNAAVIADRYGQIAVEEHGVLFMIRNRKQAKTASDRAISKQKLLLKSKLGPRYIEAPTSFGGVGNSQVCVCGTRVPKDLEDRVHRCPTCGIVADRDHMAANVVLSNVFGFASLSLRTPAAGQTVVRRGENKIPMRESLRDELAAASSASEFSVKRQPLVRVRHTTGAEATVEGKTTSHRERRRDVVVRIPLEGAPQPTAKRRMIMAPSDSTHALKSV